MMAASITVNNADMASLFFFIAMMLLGMRHVAKSPIHSFVQSWAMRISLSLFLSFLTNYLSTVQRPITALFIINLLIIFLFESIKLWLMTGMLSKIDLPLFPRFYTCDESFIWPIGKMFESQREIIKSAGFHEDIMLKVGTSNIVGIYSPVLYSEDKKIRMQVIFSTAHPSYTFISYILKSCTTSGETIITSNFQSAMSCFYPESWSVKKLPMASIEKLLEIHNNRIEGKDLELFENKNSLEELNLEQFQIETENCNAGFCERTEGNKTAITYYGRYRLWCDMISFSYIGI